MTEPAIPLKSTRVFRFDPFEVDAAAGQLRKHGVKLRLSGQPLEILLMLLEQHGFVVTREEIQQRLWPQDTFVDFENSLNKAINKLRQALSDSPNAPTYIETLPRRGYRFLAPVQCVETPPVQPQLASPASSPFSPGTSPRSSRSGHTYLVLGAAVVFLLPALLFFRTQPVPHVVKVVPLTATSRVDMFGHMQTDGVRLFFLERQGDHWQLSQMPASGGPAQPFPVPFPNAKVLAVSPDASELLLAPFTQRNNALELWLMPSVGGAPRRLPDVHASTATFTPDGTQVTFANNDGIFQIGRDGLNLRKLADVKGDKFTVAWSPDGRELRFDWVVPPSQGATLWSVDSSGHNLHQLLPALAEYSSQCCGHFSRDGRYFFFLGFSSDGTRAFFARRENAGLFSRPDLIRLETSPLLPDDIIVGRDGNRIYSVANVARVEYVRFDPAAREFHSLLGGTSAVWLNLTSSLDLAVYRGDSSALWISKPDGSGRRVLAAAALHPELPSFRPNGREIAFESTPPASTVTRISLASSEGSAVRDLVTEPFSVIAPSWSPDGSQLLYAADPDDSAHTGLYVMNYATGQKQKIPGSQGYWKARFSPDGKWIASVFQDQTSIGLYNVAAQTWTTIAHARVFSPVAWAPDSSALFFQDLLEEHEPVHRYALATRKTDVAFECKSLLEGGVMRCGFEDVLSDGSLLLQLTRGDHDVYSIELFLP